MMTMLRVSLVETFRNNAEVAQGVQDAVVIDSGGDVVGFVFQRIDGVTHRNADACLPNHGCIVAAVAKGYGVAGVETIVLSYGQDALSLVGSVGGNISELRVPAARDAVRQTGHQQPFVVGWEEGCQLQDILPEHLFQWRGFFQILDGQHLLEDTGHRP